MAEPLRVRHHRIKQHPFLEAHRSHKMKRQRHGAQNELNSLRLERQGLRELSSVGSTTPLSHYSIHTEPASYSTAHQDYHSVVNTFPGDSSSSSFTSMTEPIHDTNPSSSLSSDEPVVDLTNDSGLEDDEPIDLTVQHSRVSRNIPQRLHLYNQDRPSCRYAPQSTPDSPDVVILCVSDNEDASFSTPSTKQKKPSSASGSESDNEKKNTNATGSLTCPICMESVEQFRRSGRQLVTTVCGHIFCNSCIRNSITRMHQCPNCRKKLTLKQYHALYI